MGDVELSGLEFVIGMMTRQMKSGGGGGMVGKRQVKRITEVIP